MDFRVRPTEDFSSAELRMRQKGRLAGESIKKREMVRRRQRQETREECKKHNLPSAKNAARKESDQPGGEVSLLRVHSVPKKKREWGAGICKRG